MGTRSIYHVVPDADHGWKISLEGTSVGTQGFASREEAVDKATELARVAEEGEVVVHDINGAVERQRAYRAGVEQRPS